MRRGRRDQRQAGPPGRTRPLRRPCRSSGSRCSSRARPQEITFPQVFSRAWKSHTKGRSCQRRKGRPSPLPLPTFPFFPGILSASASLRCVWIVVVLRKSSSSNMQRNEAGSSDGPQRTRLLHKSPFHSLFAKNFNTKLNCKVAY